MSDERQASERALILIAELTSAVRDHERDMCPRSYVHDAKVKLMAHIADLEADRARLDWLEQNSATICVFDPPSGDAWVWEVAATDDSNKACDPWGNGDTLREAIDAAIAASPLAPTQEGE